MNKILGGCLIFLVALCMMALFALLFAYPTMWLWNWLMPSIFGLTKITVWKAFGINLLSTLLFKSSSNVRKEK